MGVILFVLCCLATALAVIFVTLLSPKPHTLVQHLLGIARLFVLAGVALGATRILDAGAPPPIDSQLFVIGTTVIYVIQVSVEVTRQRRWRL